MVRREPPPKGHEAARSGSADDVHPDSLVIPDGRVGHPGDRSCGDSASRPQIGQGIQELLLAHPWRAFGQYPLGARKLESQQFAPGLAAVFTPAGIWQRLAVIHLCEGEFRVYLPYSALSPGLHFPGDFDGAGQGSPPDDVDRWVHLLGLFVGSGGQEGPARRLYRRPGAGAEPGPRFGVTGARLARCVGQAHRGMEGHDGWSGPVVEDLCQRREGEGRLRRQHDALKVSWGYQPAAGHGLHAYEDLIRQTRALPGAWLHFLTGLHGNAGRPGPGDVLRVETGLEGALVLDQALLDQLGQGLFDGLHAIAAMGGQQVA